ncbi:hypothetical protein BJX65DRAFT_301475 [Aspergillus insuetus]
MEVEEDMILSVNEGQSWVLENIAILEGALVVPLGVSTSSAVDELILGQRLLRTLHLDAQRMISDLRRHDRGYIETRRRVHLIEDAKRGMEGKTDTEVWLDLGERARKEQKAQEEMQRAQEQRRDEDNKDISEETVCPCIIL